MNENCQSVTAPDVTGTERAARPPVTAGDAGAAKSLAAFSHDMRNALGAISAAADVLAITIGPHDSATANEALGIISRQTRTLTRLLDDLAQGGYGQAALRPGQPGGASRTAAVAAAAPGPGIDSLPFSRRCTVLVVQEDPALLEELCTALRLDGHAVSIATDGADGLAKLLATRPDVSIVDSGPRLPAFDFASRARAAGYAGRMVVLSAAGSAWRTRDALSAGFDACLALPVERKALRASIETA